MSHNYGIPNVTKILNGNLASLKVKGQTDSNIGSLKGQTDSNLASLKGQRSNWQQSYKFKRLKIKRITYGLNIMVKVQTVHRSTSTRFP